MVTKPSEENSATDKRETRNWHSKGHLIQPWGYRDRDTTCSKWTGRETSAGIWERGTRPGILKKSMGAIGTE
jgi:hypothetical protein